PRDLDDDAIQLVKYALVSIRRCHETVLTGGVVLVTTRMTAAGFSTWIVAQYLQSAEYQAAVARDRRNEITHADKKYLRVSYGVLKRWPREPKDGCGHSKLDALQDIRDALLGLRRPLFSRPAPPPQAVARRPVAPQPVYEPVPVPAVVPRAEEAPAVSEAALSPAGEVPEQTPASAGSQAETVAPAAPTPPPQRPRPLQKAAPPAPEPPPPPARSRPGPRAAPGAPEGDESPAAPRPGRRQPGPPRRRPR
ncbi:MAG TPA: hypothetical protein VF756_16575, partial [Thermoanaerobaculia bacterium]